MIPFSIKILYNKRSSNEKRREYYFYEGLHEDLQRMAEQSIF